METKTIDFTVSKENLKEDILTIYTRLFDDVKKEDLRFEELKGGNINLICLVANRSDKDKWIIFRNFNMKQNNQKEIEKAFEETRVDDQTDLTDESKKDRSIFKLLFDREGEIRLMNELSKHQLTQAVLAKWANGIAYRYTHGVVCNGAIMLRDEFLHEMSLKLARLHTLKIDQPEIGFKTHFERGRTHTGPMMDAVGKSVQAAIEKVDVLPYKNFPKLIYLKEMANKIVEKMYQLGLEESDVRLCMNDLNGNNIIWNQQADPLNQIGLIDLEMMMPNYTALELGYMFMCFTGYFLYGFEPEHFPDQAYRLRFIRNYLQERNRLDGETIGDNELENRVDWLHNASNLATLWNFLLIIMSLPALDFRKDLFKNPDLDPLVEGKPHYFGEIALRIYEFWVGIEAEFMKQVDEYLKRSNLAS